MGASQVALVVKNRPASAGDIRDTGLIPGLGRCPGGWHGNPFQYSCLENPHGQSAWGLKSTGLYRAAQDWSDLTGAQAHTCRHIHSYYPVLFALLFPWVDWVLWRLRTCHILLWISYSTSQNSGHLQGLINHLSSKHHFGKCYVTINSSTIKCHAQSSVPDE